MNPNLLNLLQQQQSQQTSGQEANSAMDNTAVNNPFDSGIRKAIESARQSLGMTRDQENAALRRGMLTFANQIGQAPRERGVAANIASIGRAMIPGMMEYDNYEQNALNSNNNLANQIISYQQQEAQRQAEEEQRAWQRQLQEQALNERKRSTNLLETFRRDKLNADSAGNQSGMDKDTRKELIKRNVPVAEELAKSYQNTEVILDDVKELTKLLKTSKLAGADTFSAFKRMVAKQTGKDVDVLNAKNLAQFYITWMNENSKGALSDKDIIYYNSTFADIEKNPKASVIALERLEKKLKNVNSINKKRLKAFEQNPGANIYTLDLLTPDKEEEIQKEVTTQQKVPTQLEAPNDDYEAEDR